MKPSCELCGDISAKLAYCDCCDQLYCSDCVEWIKWDTVCVSSYCWSEGWAHEVFDIDFLRVKGVISESLVAKHGPYKK